MKYSNITLRWEYTSDLIDTFIIYRSLSTNGIIKQSNIINELNKDSREYIDTNILAQTEYVYVVASKYNDSILYSTPIKLKSGDNSGLVIWDNTDIQTLINLDYTTATIENTKIYANDVELNLMATSCVIDDDYIHIKNGGVYKNVNSYMTEHLWGCIAVDLVDSSVWYANIAELHGFALHRYSTNNSFRFNWWCDPDAYRNIYDINPSGKMIIFAYYNKSTGYTKSYVYINGKRFVNVYPIPNRPSLNNNGYNYVSTGYHVDNSKNMKDFKLHKFMIGIDYIDEFNIDRMIGDIAHEYNYLEVLPDEHPYKINKPMETYGNLSIEDTQLLRKHSIDVELNSLQSRYHINGRYINYPSFITQPMNTSTSWVDKLDGHELTSTLSTNESNSIELSKLKVNYNESIPLPDITQKYLSNNLIYPYIEKLNKKIWVDATHGFSVNDSIAKWTNQGSLGGAFESWVDLPQVGTMGILFNNSPMRLTDVLLDDKQFYAISISKIHSVSQPYESIYALSPLTYDYNAIRQLSINSSYGDFLGLVDKPFGDDFFRNGISKLGISISIQTYDLVAGLEHRYIFNYTDLGASRSITPRNLFPEKTEVVILGGINSALKSVSLTNTEIMEFIYGDEFLDMDTILKIAGALAFKYKAYQTLSITNKYKYIPPFKEP